MAGREPWERYSGDEIEAVIAIMLLRENPSGQRIRPSKGDGGVDVLICHSSDRWEVFQVKGFTTSLNASQKRQIRKSWNRLLQFAEDHNVTVASWHCVRPLDPTHEDRVWLDELTAGSGIKSDWIGLTQVDGWACKYPDVIDYYFHGGRDRVLEIVHQFLAATSLDKAVERESVIEPAEAIEGLIGLHRSLNASDPHYRYDLHVEEAAEPGEIEFAPSVPGLVFSSTLIHNGVMAQIDVIARYNEATEDRPIPVKFVLKPGTEEEREAVADFVKYGASVERVPAEVVEADLPGGFSLTDVRQGRITILPTEADIGIQLLELFVVKGNNAPKTLLLRMSAPGKALDGSGGWSWEGADLSGLLHLDLRFSPSKKLLTVQTHFGSIAGLRPSKAFSALSVISMITAGSNIGLRFENGPTLFEVKGIESDLIDVGRVQEQLDFCSTLIELQRYIPRSLVVPGVGDLTMDDVRAWREAASLSRGSVIWREWRSIAVKLQDGQELSLPSRMRITKPLTVRMLGRDWPIGFTNMEFIAGDWKTMSSDGLEGVFFPLDEKRIRISLAEDAVEAEQRAKTGLVQIASFPANPS